MPARALIAATIAVCAGAAVAVASNDPRIDAAADPTSGLSQRQLAGQMVVYSFAGTHVPGRLVDRVRRAEVGGVILFTRNIGSRQVLRSQMNRLHRAANASVIGEPLPVMIDQEGGLVKRLGGAPSHSPAELGQIGRSSLARREGAATARNLRSVGVNVDLAPVLDVGRRGSFQRRTGRSYSGDPAEVGRLGSAFVSGLQGGGVAATLKHFPGLGTVSGDEDLRVQRVGLSRAQLRSIDEAPFLTAIRDKAKLVMTSTAIYPAFDDSPALLSSALSDTELRGHAGFDGVAITDDLEVPAMRRYGSPRSLALKSARAGNDMLLFAQHYGNAVAGHSALLRSIGTERLRKSAQRVIELRQGLP